MMNGAWHTASQTSGEVSDILEPEEFQEVMAAASGVLSLDNMFNENDELCYQNQEEPEQKYSVSDPHNSTGTTFHAHFSARDNSHLPTREEYPGANQYSVLLDGSPATRIKWAEYQDEPEPKLYAQVPYTSADSTFHTHYFAQATGPLPAREDYPGPYQFSVLLDGSPATRNKWAYSNSLNKLYIVWNKVIPIQFKWSPHESDFVVRALPVYTDAQDMKNPVLRCVLHSNADEETNEGFEYIKHVIRSENTGSIYEENPESGRCSVVVPLGEPQPGTGTVTVTFKFMCKTTCVTGMMRRPITVLFTLERSSGEVVGRQKLNVKICSCPARDMKKDELSSEGGEPGSARRSMSLMEKNVANRLSKRIKVEAGSDSRTLVVQFEDKETFKKMLDFNHGAATSLLRRTPRTHASFSALTDFLNLVETKINNNNPAFCAQTQPFSTSMEMRPGPNWLERIWIGLPKPFGLQLRPWQLWKGLCAVRYQAYLLTYTAANTLFEKGIIEALLRYRKECYIPEDFACAFNRNDLVLDYLGEFRAKKNKAG